MLDKCDTRSTKFPFLVARSFHTRNWLLTVVEVSIKLWYFWFSGHSISWLIIDWSIDLFNSWSLLFWIIFLETHTYIKAVFFTTLFFWIEKCSYDWMVLLQLLPNWQHVYDCMIVTLDFISTSTVFVYIFLCPLFLGHAVGYDCNAVLLHDCNAVLTLQSHCDIPELMLCSAAAHDFCPAHLLHNVPYG